MKHSISDTEVMKSSVSDPATDEVVYMHITRRFVRRVLLRTLRFMFSGRRIFGGVALSIVLLAFVIGHYFLFRWIVVIFLSDDFKSGFPIFGSAVQSLPPMLVIGIFVGIFVGVNGYVLFVMVSYIMRVMQGYSTPLSFRVSLQRFAGAMGAWAMLIFAISIVYVPMVFMVPKMKIFSTNFDDVSATAALAITIYWIVAGTVAYWLKLRIGTYFIFVAIDDGGNPWAIIRRTWQLTRAQTWNTLKLLLALGLIMIAMYIGSVMFLKALGYSFIIVLLEGIMFSGIIILFYTVFAQAYIMIKNNDFPMERVATTDDTAPQGMQHAAGIPMKKRGVVKTIWRIIVIILAIIGALAIGILLWTTVVMKSSTQYDVSDIYDDVQNTVLPEDGGARSEEAPMMPDGVSDEHRRFDDGCMPILPPSLSPEELRARIDSGEMPILPELQYDCNGVIYTEEEYYKQQVNIDH